MSFTIRPARASDKEDIAAFTADTFDWGDYVADAFDRWLAESDGIVFVAENDDGQVVGMARVAMLSPTEAWAQAARVHPRFRRRGIASALTLAGFEWARNRGGKVVRLVTEDWNEAAQAQVESLGFRTVSRWTMWSRPVGDAAPKVTGNGGSRVRSEERLSVASSSEADAAFFAASTGELASAGRGFITEGWSWRKLRPADLTAAAARRAMWVCPAGWVIGETDDERPDTFWVSWVMTVAEDADRLIRAVVDRAADEGAERLVMLLPDVEWLQRAARKAGLTEGHRLLVYEHPL